MGKRLYCNITIRGVTYPTAQAAARALAVQEQTVQRAARLGVLDQVGLGKGRKERLPVSVRGVVYPDAHSASAATGLAVNTIYNAIARGHADRVGLGPVYDRPPNAQPIVLGPLSFPSQTEAERVLGFSRGYISRAKRLGWMESVVAAAMRVAQQRGGAA